SHGLGAVELRDGAGTQLRIKSGECGARPAAGAEGRDTAATVAGVVLSSGRQSGQEASHAGGGNLFCPVAALGTGLVARRVAGTGPGIGCDDVGTTLHGAVRERAGARLRHSGGLEGAGLQPERLLATVLASVVGPSGWRDSGGLEGAGVG